MPGSGLLRHFAIKSINYMPSEKSKSDIYVDLLPLLNSGAVALLEHERAGVATHDAGAAHGEGEFSKEHVGG